VPRFGTETPVHQALANNDNGRRSQEAYFAREIGKTMLGRLFATLRRIFARIANSLRRRQSLTDLGMEIFAEEAYQKVTGRKQDSELNIAEEALSMGAILLDPDTVVFHTASVNDLGHRKKNPLRNIKSEQEGKETGGLGDRWFSGQRDCTVAFVVSVAHDDHHADKGNEQDRLEQ
jgi:hypothetical protein